jgi:DNA polymerase bacteriophage-type
MDLRPYPHEPAAIIDFETRSGVSLRTHGTWRYSEDRSTHALCLAFRLPYWESGRTGLWHPPFPSLGIEECDLDDTLELLEWVQGGGLVEAHNAWFERCIWQNIMVPRYGFNPIGHRQWRCSAAKAAALALPRALGDAVKALGLTTLKDDEGSKVMKKMTKPRKPRKAEREAWEAIYGPKVPHERLYHETRELMERLWRYCRQDVLAEEALSRVIFDLSPAETEMYLLDQRVNERGFQIDIDAARSALNLIQREQVRLNRELVKLTDGKVKKATQRAQMLDWFQEHELYLVDTQKATIEETLKSSALRPEVRRALELMQALGRSSTAKYQAMVAQASLSDQRVRGGLLYHGASTGRWSGSGVQPHNFPRGTVKIKDYDALWKAIKSRRRARVVEEYGDLMAVMSSALRSAITAGPGKVLYVADYAAIEARVLLWLANDERALDVFRKGEDIYCDMASSIYNRPINKKDHPEERQLGKVAILGLGYQMGASKFVDTAAGYGIIIEEDLSQLIVDAYREKFYLVKRMWREQEEAACRAVRSKSAQPCGRVVWFMRGRFLFCQLPSGRRLAYCDPQVREVTTPWGAMRDQLSYKAVNSLTRKWMRQTTYGGMLVENITQAVSRDILAEAMSRCESHGWYLPVLSVHDEIIAESDEGQGDVKEFEALMTALPSWAIGCPIAAEGWCGFRYRK